MYLIILTIVSLMLTGVCFADNDITVGELPISMQEEIRDIFNGNLKLIGLCPKPQPKNINYLLYNRKLSGAITLNSTTIFAIDPKKEIKFIIHGWNSDVSTMVQIRDAYLYRYDCNIIMVDWSSIAEKLYTTAFCELPALGQFLGVLLCLLFEELNISLDRLHLVGHSMGAHLSGLAGQYTRETCNQTIGRITGLDPAGPLYYGLPKDDKLDPSDALFVDVIHTNELCFGYWGNLGDVDFHVNCGYHQSGCPSVRPRYMSQTLTSIIFCSHTRSKFLMAESILNDTFIAQNCDLCPLICIGGLFSPSSYITMGEDCPRYPPKHVYWLPTSSTPPFSLGCTPYGPKCSYS